MLNLSNALKILNLNKKYNIYNIENLDIQELKKYYYIAALNYHPDKNIDNDTTDIFKEINDAYLYLKLYIENNYIKDNLKNQDTNIDIDIDKNTDTDLNFLTLLLSFIKLLSINEANDKNIINNFNKFKTNCIDYSNNILINFIDKLNINIIEDLYNFLNNNKININDNFRENLKDILIKKLEKYNIFILHPNLKNLFENDLYKLNINNETVYVPLWHRELIYDDNLIKIQPILEENLYIDNDNILNYNYYLKYKDILEKIEKNITEIIITIHKLIINIPIYELYFRNYQIYQIKNKGISKINNENIFDTNIKCNINIHIFLE